VQWHFEKPAPIATVQHSSGVFVGTACLLVAVEDYGPRL
jgi:hypothetical protein